MTSSQTILEEKHFEQKVFKTENGTVLPYCVKQTCPEQSGKTAVFFFLHGAGERGSDNCAQLIHGSEAVVEYLESRQIKCLVVFPQCAEGMQWVDTPWDGVSHTMPEQPSVMMSAALSLLAGIVKAPETDTARIYLSGISMGGYGAWDALSRQPGLFAGALICCGGGDTAQALKIKDVPVTVYHGSADGVVPVIRSRNMVKALKDSGSKNVFYHELRGVNHDCWTTAFNDSCNWHWLFGLSGKK